MKTPESSDPVERPLAEWRVNPPRDPGFRGGVWKRIEAAQGTSSWGAFARSHAALVAGVLAVAVVAGAVTGRERARARLRAESGELANAYVQAMDARTMQLP